MQGQYNLRSPAVKRLMREAQELREPTEQYFAQPLEDNLFEWHFTIRGPTETEFEDGIYHGRIVLPPEYPMKPPSIILLTANGRFETHKKICLSISGHHPESWQPSWSIRTALLAIIGFMPTHGNGAIGSLDYTPEERKSLAKKSLEWKCPECGSVRLCLREVTEASKALSKEAKELGAQINMQGEKEKGSTSDSPKEDETDSPQTTSPATPEAAAAQPGLYPNMPSFPGFSPQMLQMMRAHFANAPGGMPPMGMNPFMSNMMNAGAGPQAGPGGTPNRPQGMPNFPFWPPNFGTLSGGSAIPRFPMWPPGVTVPTNTNTTDSVQVASSSDLISSSSPQSVTGTTSTSPTVTSMPSASPSVSTSTGARPKSSSSAEANSPGSTSTSSSPPSPESASVSGSTPESTSNQTPTSSDTAPASDPVSTAITPPTGTPPGTSASAPSGVRQRNVGPAQAQGIIPGVGQHAELPRPQQSEGLSFSLCLLTLLGIALAILMIRRLIMMDIIRFYDTIE